MAGLLCLLLCVLLQYAERIPVGLSKDTVENVQGQHCEGLLPAMVQARKHGCDHGWQD